MMYGLGAYPTDSYYDPNRSSWVPYWIDTPTESAMKYGMYPGADTKTVYPNPPAPVPPVAVDVSVDPGGLSVTPDGLVTATADANKQQTQSFFTGVANQLNAAQSTSIFNGVTLLYIAAGVLVFMALKR